MKTRNKKKNDKWAICSLPRRLMKKKPGWCAEVVVFVNGKEQSMNIRFGALHGGEAKTRAFSIIRGILERAFSNVKGCIRLSVLLKKKNVNGNGNGGAPSYVLRERCSYLNAFIRAKRASQVFRLA